MSLIINDNEDISLPGKPMPLLDFLREKLALTAAKPGCGTGDCGSCLVLVGEIEPGQTQPRYRTVNSCLVSTAQLDGCHVITPEGLNGAELTPVQRALVQHGTVQCAYCTPGLTVALTAALLEGEPTVGAAEGNLCRCTGYAAIRRCCHALDSQFPARARTLAEAVEAGLLADGVALASRQLKPQVAEALPASVDAAVRAGNTDYGVQHPYGEDRRPAVRIHHVPSLRRIQAQEDVIVIGAAVTIHELQQDALIREAWAPLSLFLTRFASPSIRHQATVGGNLVNASPVADLAVALLALDAELVLVSGADERYCRLADFYRGYHLTALRPHEILTAVKIPRNRDGQAVLHLEKVAKRELDDIATVNSAFSVTGGLPGCLGEVRFSAGGVAPFPRLLAGTSAFLGGKPVSATMVREAMRRLDAEISPIDDVRGSAVYKRRLLKHLLAAHVAGLYPELAVEDCLHDS